MTERACRARLAALAFVFALAAPSAAHEVRPAYLELRELGGGRFAVLWKVPARGELRLALAVELPARCAASERSTRSDTGGAIVERWSVDCGGDLAGETVAIGGLDATVTDVLARIERSDGSSQVVRLTPTERSFVVAGRARPLAVAATYVRLGIEHIWLGADHLLFVLGLVILVPERRRLVGTITAFTVAHSLTLAAATLGWTRLAPEPVEAVIALSIVFVAGEIAHGAQGRSGWTRRWPWLVAFSFGLLHGFGFAGALREVGLPEQQIPLALLCFNLGVEVGQLAFVLAVWPVVAWLRRRAGASPAWLRAAPAYAIGGLAAFWTFERVAAFWR